MVNNTWWAAVNEPVSALFTRTYVPTDNIVSVQTPSDNIKWTKFPIWGENLV